MFVEDRGVLALEVRVEPLAGASGQPFAAATAQELGLHSAPRSSRSTCT
jgi:hypothetical protein